MGRKIDKADAYVGKYFTDLRISHRYTQDQISEILGISRATYCTYEIGTRGLPMKIMKKLCTLYHLNFYKVFEDLDKECEKLGLYE